MYQDATSEKGAEVSVLSVKLIRDYQSIAISKRSNFLSQCINVVSGDFNHPSTLERKNQKLHSHLSALYILDSSEFFNVLIAQLLPEKFNLRQLSYHEHYNHQEILQQSLQKLKKNRVNILPS